MVIYFDNDATLTEYISFIKEKNIPENTLLKDLGLSSLGIVSVMVAFEEEFGIKILDQELPTIATVGDVIELLKKIKNNVI